MNTNTTPMNYVEDANGNRNYFDYFGGQEAAQRALDGLAECRNCTNCSDCSGCSRCSDCSDCSGCSDCSDCSDCSGCSGCSRCSGCSGCSRCSDCSDCSGLTDNKPTVQPSPVIPKIENIHTKVLDAVSNPGALNMATWHTCGTTHCRAGWVVHLAGEPGCALEAFHTTEMAAMLIYRESSPHRVNPGRYYDDNEKAMADIQRMAELEKASAA